MDNSVIIVVEDDKSLREAIVETLCQCGHEVVAYKDGIAALNNFESIKPSLIISDVQMKPINGLDLMLNIHNKDPDIPVILITAYGTIERAVDAIKAGAKDYLVKPFEPEVLISKVDKHIRKVVFSKKDQMIAVDKIMVDLSKLALRVARSEVTVMITGESGTGKEVLSKYIHRNSKMKDGPFIAINCAAIPENMLEAILFGYEKGAFTGAHQSSPGKFELAQGGTILLDEISEMDLSLQAKILRVLQEREVERLGSKKTISLNVRVIATSNRDMKKEVAEGRFREDLYYRLNVFPLRIPSLCERKEDIKELSIFLLNKWSSSNGLTVNHITDDAINVLKAHSWPGNVRELDNVIQRAMIMTDNNEITPDSLHIENMIHFSDMGNSINHSSAIVDIKDNEYKLIINILESVSWSRKKTASKLGISERTLRYKMSKMRKNGYSIQAG